MKKKDFFIIFNRFLDAKNCFRPEGAPLNDVDAYLKERSLTLSLSNKQHWLNAIMINNLLLPYAFEDEIMVSWCGDY